MIFQKVLTYSNSYRSHFTHPAVYSSLDLPSKPGCPTTLMDKKNLTQQYYSRNVFRLHLGHRLSIGSPHLNKCREILYCYFQSLCVSLVLNWYNSCPHSRFEFYVFAYLEPIEIHKPDEVVHKTIFFLSRSSPKYALQIT